MIYTQTGVLAKQYTVVDGIDDFAHLVTTTATPTQAQNLTNNQLETFKHTSAPYVVYGLVDGTDRADSEVTARTILLLDVDGNEATYNEVKDRITAGLRVFVDCSIMYRNLPLFLRLFTVSVGKLRRE